MTFTYDLASVDENLLNISRVRLELGDTQENVGVRPDGSNLQDEEILLWLSEEGNEIPSTVGRACNALANMWTNVANITTGPRKEELGKVADGWAKRAAVVSPVDSTTYQIQTVAVDRKHDPYQYRPEDESGR